MLGFRILWVFEKSTQDVEILSSFFIQHWSSVHMAEKRNIRRKHTHTHTAQLRGWISDPLMEKKWKKGTNVLRWFFFSVCTAEILVVIYVQKQRNKCSGWGCLSQRTNTNFSISSFLVPEFSAPDLKPPLQLNNRMFFYQTVCQLSAWNIVFRQFYMNEGIVCRHWNRMGSDAICPKSVFQYIFRARMRYRWRQWFLSAIDRYWKIFWCFYVILGGSKKCSVTF